MIRINEQVFISEKQITRYEIFTLRESEIIKTETKRNFIHGNFINALLHLDFSRKNVTYYYDSIIFHWFLIGELEDVKKYCSENSKKYRIIDGKVYDMPKITFYLSDGSEYTIYFSTDKSMRKMANKLNRKINKN